MSLKFRHSLVVFLLIFSHHIGQAEPVVITLAGDFGLNDTKAQPSAAGGYSGESRSYVPYRELTSRVRHLFDSDVNMVNLESAVLADLPNRGIRRKSFLFSTHPVGIQHMLEMGINVFTLGNNHVYDYGETGLRQTLSSLDALRELTPFVSVGAGLDLEEAKRVQLMRVGDITIAIGSIGIIDNSHLFHRAGENTPGTLSVRNRNGHDDFELVLDEIRETPADYRILAIHFGNEYQVELDPGQREDYHQALEIGNIDLIVGHHPHVVRPVECVRVDGRERIIAYSLGNFLHLGTGKIEHREAPYNFGAVLKVRLDVGEEQKVRPIRLEMYPLLGMHLKPYSPGPEVCRELIESYNSEIATTLPGAVKFDYSSGTDPSMGSFDLPLLQLYPNKEGLSLTLKAAGLE